MAHDSLKKASLFRQVMTGGEPALIVAHDYPDPDCLASAYGIQQLLKFWGMGNPVITFGGFVGRAQNRMLIDQAGIAAVPFERINLDEFQRIVTVDCLPGNGNVSLPPGKPVDAVFDHHGTRSSGTPARFQDIRGSYSSTSMIVTQYLTASAAPISPSLATALFYGIKTDTRDMTRGVTSEELAGYSTLFGNMDHALLARIENPDRDTEYFRLVHRASEQAMLYDTVCHTGIGRISTPDYVAEMADFFFRYERIRWMVCSGIYGDNLFYSIRSKNERKAGGIAERIARKAGGSGGGHGNASAGKIPREGRSDNDLFAAFKKVFLNIFHLRDEEGKTIF